MAMPASDEKRQYDAAWKAANPDRVRQNYLASQERLKADPSKLQALRRRERERAAVKRSAQPPDPAKALVAILAAWGVKTCLRCSATKAFADFAAHKLGSSGLNSWCRQCCYAHAKTPEARVLARAAKAARFAEMTPAERRRARGYRAVEPPHDAHVAAYHAVAKRFAAWVERAARKLAREAERRAKLLAEPRIPPTASCGRIKKLKRKFAIERATPPWADLDAIAAKYEHARRLTEETGDVWTVDHYVPLQNPLVCGLHVPWNLDPMRRDVNSLKGNKVWPDMP